MAEEEETYNRDRLVRELASENYAVNQHPRDKTAEVAIYVHPAQDAGGKLAAILSRWGYGIQYVSPHDSDDFCMEVTCLPVVYLDSFTKTNRLLDGPKATDTTLKNHLERCNPEENDE